MAYVLTEEQEFLKSSAKDLLKGAPVALVRELRDNNSELGYSDELWKAMVEMGWPATALTEDLGGLDFGLKGLNILMEECGRTLSNSPLFSSLLSGLIIQKYGNQSQKDILKESVTEGGIIAVAVQEGETYNPKGNTAQMTGGALSGEKTMVADAHVASHFIVACTGERGVEVLLVPAGSAGVKVREGFYMDSRYYSTVHFDKVAVSVDQILSQGKGKSVVNYVTNCASLLLSSELIGLMTEAFERTVAYIKERRQFDKVIGSFQGLQHRAADLYGEIEVAKSLVLKAVDALDEEDIIASALCSMAKAKSSKVAQLATNEGVQMYGGIGMTDDEEIGFFLKRARVAITLFGNYSYHLNRFAKMSGY
jgi:acyl-CoA dehydrogenase